MDYCNGWYCNVITFEFNDIISLYTKTDSERRRPVTVYFLNVRKQLKKSQNILKTLSSMGFDKIKI